MTKTVVGSFNSYEEAQQVVQELTSNGVPRDDISLVANDAAGRPGNTAAATPGEHATASRAGTGAVTGGAIGGAAGLIAGLAGLAIPGIGPIIAAGPIAAALAGAGVGAVAGGLIGGLTSIGVPEEHAGYYAEAVRRGGALVTVRADEPQAERVAEIMNRYGAVDIDRQAATWRQEGWTGFDANAQPLAGEQLDRQREAVLPVVEENVQVGKREVERGGVRVFSRVTEQPVEQQVQLREEHARVERRPVDRAATDADLATFKEGTIEVRERAEEPVVSKQARVVEEVVVGKETTERTETIRDSVRRTDVDVQPLAQGQARTSADSAYRSHFDTAYGTSGARYDEYAPAYQYGNRLFGDQRYQGRDWTDIESDVRQDWERTNPGGAWERFKAAVRHGFDVAANKIEHPTQPATDRSAPMRNRP